MKTIAIRAMGLPVILKGSVYLTADFYLSTYRVFVAVCKLAMVLFEHSRTPIFLFVMFETWT